MARLIAKNYANYDRKDARFPRFPRFRTFDLWRGHSFADGEGFPDGNNQESTGEPGLDLRHPMAAFYDRDSAFIQKVYADVEREQKTFEEKEAAKKPGTTPKLIEIKTLAANSAPITSAS